MAELYECNMCGEEKCMLWQDICDECEEENRKQLNKISDLEKEGHPSHCAARQVWGDGLCECRVKYPLKIGK